MNALQSLKLALGGSVAAMLLAALLLAATLPARAQDGQPLLPGTLMRGNLTSALGDQWALYGCAGDVMTVTLASTAFTPYLAVFTDTLESPIAEAVSEDGEPAELAVAVDETGTYAVVAAGDRRSARGTYTITVRAVGSAQAAADVDAPVLLYGTTITGVVQSSTGERWRFRGCAGDAVTVSAASDDFTPYVELFDPAAAETVAESEATAAADAVLAGVPFSTTGSYELIVAGQRRSDRGAYTLTLSLATTATLAPPATSGTPTATLPPVVVPPTPTRAPFLHHPGQSAQPARRPWHELLAAHRRAAAEL